MSSNSALLLLTKNMFSEKKRNEKGKARQKDETNGKSKEGKLDQKSTLEVKTTKHKYLCKSNIHKMYCANYININYY